MRRCRRAPQRTSGFQRRMHAAARLLRTVGIAAPDRPGAAQCLVAQPKLGLGVFSGSGVAGQPVGYYGPQQVRDARVVGAGGTLQRLLQRGVEPPTIHLVVGHALQCSAPHGAKQSTGNRSTRLPGAVTFRSNPMRIYVTSIIEQGTHEQLLQAGSHYAELYNAYFRSPANASTFDRRDGTPPEPGPHPDRTAQPSCGSAGITGSDASAVRIVKPKRLKRGGRVAAVSLSWGGPGAFPHRYAAGKRQFEQEFGVAVTETAHARREPDWLARNPRARADDLMAALADPNVDAIIATIGGGDSIRLLPRGSLPASVLPLNAGGGGRWGAGTGRGSSVSGPSA